MVSYIDSVKLLSCARPTVLVVALMVNFPESLVMVVTPVLSRRVAAEFLIMLSKICQFPPRMDMAPSPAMETIVSKP